MSKSKYKQLNTSGHFPDFWHKAASQRKNKKIRSHKERRILNNEVVACQEEGSFLKEGD